MSTNQSPSVSIVVSGSRRRKIARRRTKSTKPKTVPVSKLKKQLEALQKQVVIQLYGRDCFTCEAKDLWGKNCHLGHVPWPRTDLSTKAKFSHEYTRIQCMVCNIHKGGAGAKAWVRMQAQGIDMETLRENSDKEKGKTVPRSWFEEKIAYYQSLVDKPV